MTNRFDLTGRRALVTGAGTGLGREAAIGLAEAGARLLLVGRRLAPLEETAAAIEQFGVQAEVALCDVTDETDVLRLDREAGRVDILVNNAGTSDRQPWLDVRPEDWNRVLNLNLWSAFRLSQLFAPAMVERSWGRIINTASAYAVVAPDRDRYPGVQSFDLPAYGASKTGLVGLTRHLAVLLAPSAVTVNALSPGMFRTDRTDSLLSGAVVKELSSRTPAGRLGRGEDLRGAVVFLASDAGAFVTGINLVVDGGYTLL